MASPSIDDDGLEKLIRMGIPGFDHVWADKTMERLHAIKPLKTGPAETQNPVVSKYKTLAQVIKYRRVEVITMPEGPAEKKVDRIMVEAKKLVDEKLVRAVFDPRTKATRFELTEDGRRFVADYERANKTTK